jgi:hypothetical protein
MQTMVCHDVGRLTLPLALILIYKSSTADAEELTIIK